VKRRLFSLACALGTVRAWGGNVCEPASSPAERLARAVDELNRLAADAARLDLPSRIHWVNVAINDRIDPVPRAVSDCGPPRWHLPAETLARGAGNCADSAILKYFLLLASGIAPPCARLLYAVHRQPDTPGLSTPHLVALAREPFVDPLALDAINLLAIPLSLRSDLEPVFSFDCQRLWAGAAGPDRGSAVERLRPWRELLARTESVPVRAAPAVHRP